MNLSEMFKGKGNGQKTGTDAEKAQKATDLLKEDHDKVKALFKQYRGLEDEGNGRAERGRLYEEIRTELTVHSKVEEEIFYPAVKHAPEEDASRLVAEATEEHGIVKTLLQDLGSLRPGEEVFEAKMKVLMEAVEHHAEEEEDEMFPEARKGLGDEPLRALGARIEARKRELLGQEAGGAAPRRAASSPQSRRARPSVKPRASSTGKRRS